MTSLLRVYGNEKYMSIRSSFCCVSILSAILSEYPCEVWELWNCRKNIGKVDECRFFRLLCRDIP